MATGLLFKDLDVTTDIDGLLGAAEGVADTIKGKKFTYSKDGTLASNSNANVPTQQAVKTYVDTKSANKSWFHTGLISGGALSINGGDNTKFDVAAGSGIFVDLSDPANPVNTNVSWVAQTALSTPYLATLAGTWVGYSKTSSAIVTSPVDFTTDQLHNEIIRLGRLSHFGKTVITGVYQLPLFYYADLEYLCLGNLFGVTNLQGNSIHANGANLRIDKNQGISFRTGAYATIDRNNPNYPITSDISPVTFYPALRSAVSGSTTLNAQTTFLVPDQYDNGSGALQSVTAGYYTIQTVLYYPANGTYTMLVLFGQAQYADFSTAMVALNSYSPVIYSDIAGGNIRAFIVIQQGTTDLSAAITAGTAYISGGSLFGTLSSGGGGGGGGGSSTPAHNNLSGLQGGVATEYYHLTDIEHGYISGGYAQSLLTTASPKFDNLALSIASIDAAGTTQGTATPITTSIALVLNGTATQGVILPSTVPIGTTVIVNGYGLSNSILVYPHVGGNIDGATTDSSVILPAKQSIGFTRNTGGATWVTTSDALIAGTGIGISHTVGGTLSISNSGVTSVAGTTNQISVSGSSGDVIISLPATLALPNGTTAVTQSQGDHSTKVATTAYVDESVGGENYWDRIGTVLKPHNIGDSVELGAQNGLFGASYSATLLADFSAGSPIATPVGGASIAYIYGSNKLDLTHGDVRYVTYSGVANAYIIQTGAIRFMLSPAYSGAPTVSQSFVGLCKIAGSSHNVCFVMHNSAGDLRVYIADYLGNPIMNANLGSWSPTAGVEYEMELDIDITAGQTRLFVDGTQHGATQTATGTRNNDIEFLVVGQYPLILGSDTQFAIRKIELFDVVLHTANYTPGYNLEALDVYGASAFNGNVNTKSLAFQYGLSDGSSNIITTIDPDGTMAADSDAHLPTQKAVVTYARNNFSGLQGKYQAQLATLNNRTLSGEQIIDDELTSVSRILVRAQTNKTENGIYVTAPGAWTRASDADTGSELIHAFINIDRGATQSGNSYYCTNNSITIGVTEIEFVLFSTPGANYALLNANNNFSGSNTFTPAVTLSGGVKDSHVTTAVNVGDALNTSFLTTNKTIIGSGNELYVNKANDSLVVHKAGVETVTGNKTLSGTITMDSLTASQLIALNASKAIVNVTALPNGTTATTQSVGDNTTKIATTAFVQNTIVAENLWDQTGSVLTPHTSGDSVTITSTTDAAAGSGSVYTLGGFSSAKKIYAGDDITSAKNISTLGYYRFTGSGGNTSWTIQGQFSAFGDGLSLMYNMYADPVTAVINYPANFYSTRLHLGYDYLAFYASDSPATLPNVKLSITRGDGYRARFTNGIYLPVRSGGTVTSLDYYETATFSATFTSAAASDSATVTIKIINRDNQVWMFIPQVYLTGNNTSTGSITTISAIPSRFRPAGPVYLPICCNTGSLGSFSWGTILVRSDGTMEIFYGPGTLTLFPICPTNRFFGFLDTMSNPWYAP